MKKLKSVLYLLFAPTLRIILGQRIISKKIKGTDLRLYYNRSQHLGFLFQHEIEYEKDFSAMVMNLIQVGDLVFEIGSNIGQYSLLISEKIGDNGKLICVEPDSDNYSSLSLNIEKNHRGNVELLHMAVSNQEGKTQFFKDTVTGGRMSSLIKAYSGNHYRGKSEEVTTTTLKKLVDHYGTPAFIKVDVEGAENLVFSNSTAITPGTIYLVEIRRETKAHIFSVFHQHGFSVFLLEHHMERINEASDLPDFGNIIARVTTGEKP